MNEEIISQLKKLDFDVILPKLDYFDGRPESESGFDPYKIEDAMYVLMELKELVDESDKTCTFGNYHPYGDRFPQCRACGKFHLDRNTSGNFMLKDEGFVMGWASTKEEAEKICRAKPGWKLVIGDIK